MDVTLLIQSLLGLIALLGVLMFLLLYTPGKAKKISAKKSQESASGKGQPTLKALKQIIKNTNASTQELEDALNLVLKHYGVIQPKTGAKIHSDFDDYLEILIHVGRHKHINKNILLGFDKELEKRNPSYKKEINDALMIGLSSREA